MNIYDVSKKAGVSIATVSRVLNGKANVSEQSRKRVLKAMKELDYTPNIFARGLGLNTMKTIGIMCSDSSDAYLANAIYYIEQELRKNGYDSLLCCTGRDITTKKKYLDLLLSKRVDGIILVGSQFVFNEPDDDCSYIIEASSELPIILVNGYIDSPNIYCVLCDDYNAVYNVTSSLIENGRNHIVYLYTSTSFSGLKKLNGYQDALKDNNINLNSEYAHLCSKNISDALDYLNNMYYNGLTFDAVVTSDDLLAVGAIKYSHKHNIKVPEQLEIIGYNNSVISRCTEPELTSIDSNVELLSMQAVDTLMKVLCGNDVSNKNIISAKIIKRNTTKF